VERVGLLYMADMGEERREIRARPPEATRETDVKRWDDVGVLTPVQSITNGMGNKRSISRDQGLHEYIYVCPT